MVSKFVSLCALPLTFGPGRWLQTAAKFRSSPHRRALSVHSNGTFQLKCYPAAIPHPEKAGKGGEDAHFVLEVEHGGTRQHSAVGVADGVGGWASQGVDAGLYSRSLMKWTRHRLQQAHEPCVHDALAFSYRMTKMLGSCTACVVLLNKGVIETLNLGDSGKNLTYMSTLTISCFRTNLETKP